MLNEILYLISVGLNITLILILYINHRIHIKELKEAVRRSTATMLAMMEHGGISKEQLNNMLIDYMMDSND